MLVEVHDMWPAQALERHKSYVDSLIDEQNEMRVPWGLATIREFVVRNRDALAIGDVGSIRRSIKDFEATCAGQKPSWRARALRKFESVFDYSGFARKSSARWCAYDLCLAANYRICPYCQQAYAMTVVREDKERCFRPTLDHYYPKSRFPFLSLSIYNLIPSCYTCNSSLKGAKDFYQRKHLHPYASSGGIGFALDMRGYNEGKAVGRRRWRADVVSDGAAAYRNSLKTFAIAERYSVLEGEIARFAENAYRYYLDSHKRYIEVLDGTGLDLDEVISLNFDESDYRNEMLGRIKRDIIVAIRVAAQQ